MPDCQHIWGTDHRWWEFHCDEVSKKYNGQCWTQDVNWPTDTNPQAWGINCLIGEKHAPGLARDKTKIHTGSNSGYAAIGLAYHLGAERILLLGYDMKMDGAVRHWFGDHPGRMNVASDYAMFSRKFATIRPEQYGIEIWNVTRSTALACFPIYNLDEIHESIN